MFKIYITKGRVSYCDIDLHESENTMLWHYRNNQGFSFGILLARINWISMEIWMDLYKSYKR